MKKLVFALLFNSLFCCKKAESIPEYPKATLNLSCTLYTPGKILEPYPNAKVYFFDFNEFRDGDRLSASPSGFDLQKSQLLLGPNMYKSPSQTMTFDSDGKATMKSVAYGRHWLVYTNIETNNPSKEIGFVIVPLVISKPIEESSHTWTKQ
jgi:hypothetical protein